MAHKLWLEFLTANYSGAEVGPVEPISTTVLGLNSRLQAITPNRNTLILLRNENLAVERLCNELFIFY